MLTVADLSPHALARQLRGDGIYLRTGMFTIHLRSAIPQVAAGLALLYGDYPVALQADFADFHLQLVQRGGLRRWHKPQVLLLNDGALAFQPLPLAQAFPVLEWGMNWCVSSRVQNCLVLHAAVIEKEGCAAILPAPPGSGKSTLCAALVHHGWRLLSDELALVRPSDGLVLPLPRPISLKNASIELIRNYLKAPVLSPAVGDTSKGTVAHLKAPSDSVARSAEPARPAWIVFPSYQAGAAPELTPVPKARSHLAVADNAFNYSLLGGLGFETMAGLVERCQAYRFSYSALDDAIAHFSRLQPAQP